MARTAPKVANIGRLNIAAETTFGSDASANGVYLQSMVIDPSSLTVESIRDEHMRAVDEEVARIIGAHRGTVTTTHYLHGFQSSVPTSKRLMIEATDSTNATAFDLLMSILASVIGNYKAGGLVTAGTVGALDTPTNTVTEADLSGFAAGEPIAWATGNTALPYYVGWLTEVDTTATPDEGTLLQSTPPYDPQGTALYGGQPVLWLPKTNNLDPYHNNGSNGGVDDQAGGQLTSPAKSWTLQLLGHDSDQHLKCYGCTPIGAKWSFPVGQLPTLEITWGVAHWEYVSSGGTPNQAGYDYPQPEACLQWWCAWGTTASTALPLKNLEVDIGITRVEMGDGSKPSGVGGWVTTKRTPTVSFTVYRDYSEEILNFTSQTGLPFTFQVGSQPGKMFALCVPNARVIENPGQGEDNGLVTSSVTLEPHKYASDTGAGASEVTPFNSALRMAWI